MSNLGHIAAPMSRAQIRNVANEIRKLFNVVDVEKLPLLQILENGIPQLIDSFTFEVVEPHELKGIYAEAIPEQPSISVRRDVYLRARAGEPRDLHTLAHELGHIVLHTDRRLQRAELTQKIQRFRDPEWQADAFAGELRMPLHLFRKLKNPDDACTVFGVSRSAYETQVRAWTLEGVI